MIHGENLTQRHVLFDLKGVGPHSMVGCLFTYLFKLLTFPSPGNLLNSGIKPESPALQADSLPDELPGKPTVAYY